MPNWKQCEGQVADGLFPLERYLGGNEDEAVFLTRIASGRAAIKLVSAGPAQARELVERWNRAATFHHPHVAGIFAAGTTTLDGSPLGYFVTEYAEEDLAEVLRNRPLTTDEAREMLLPVADALEYLHSQGLVHGDLKPSNILAVEDAVKISRETVSDGDPAADIRALGETLVQALTQQSPAVSQGGQDPALDALPFPFQEMAQNCVNPDPRLRWSAGTIGAWLRSLDQPAPTLAASKVPAAKPVAQSRRPRYYVAAIALVFLGTAMVGGLLMHRTTPSNAEPVRPAAVSDLPGPAAPPVPPAVEAQTHPGVPAAPDGIVRRVIPEFPEKALNTIHGKVTVVVRVMVDPAGNVTEAAVERSGSSYFGRLVREAALHWQFAPLTGAGTRSWILRFEIRPTATRVIPLKADR